MELDVLIFGPLARELGARSLRVRIGEPACLNDVRQALAAQVGSRREFFLNARLAVNGTFAEPVRALSADDEIAVIELVSGG